MRALADAIAAGRRRARRLTAVAVVAVVVSGVLAVIVGRAYDRGRRVTACETAASAINEVWNRKVEGRLRRGFADAGVANAGPAFDLARP